MKQSWYDELFDHIDHRRMDEFLAYLTDDIRFTIANQPMVSGKQALRLALSGFWLSIGGLKHDITQVLTGQQHVAFESTVRYTRLDGGVVTVPCATVIKLAGELISDWRIYIDIGPVFAPA